MEHELFLKRRQCLKDLVDCRIGIRSSGLNMYKISSDQVRIDLRGEVSEFFISMLLVLHHSLASGPVLIHLMPG